MKNLLSYLGVALLFVLVVHLSACKNEIEDIDVGAYLSYFPMDTGYWVIYDIDSTIYSKFIENGRTTRHCQLKEVYTDFFTDNEGRPAVRIERYVRYDTATDWADIIPNVWYAVRDSQRAERVEGDLRFMKLVFPMYPDRTWAGNAYLDTGDPDLSVYADWQYKYETVDAPYQLADTTLNGQLFSHAFDSTTAVLQQDNSNLVDKVYSREVYARHVGMVYKEQWVLNLGGKDITIPETWPDRAERGYVAIFKVLDWKH